MTLAAAACLLAVVTALCCALPGVFVVLSRESMLIDGIGHAVLPGIALGYLMTSDIDSPWLILTAALGGLLVALLTQWLSRSGLLARDSALALVFPTLFALGVLLISSQFSHVHLDVHAVLVGDLNLAAMTDPPYVYVMLAMLGVNVVFLALTAPHLTAAAFRGKGLATPFLGLVALTCTAAFHAAGAMLVIALMVFPAITARLLTRRVPSMVAATCAIAVISAMIGFWVAYHLDAATSAAMTVANAAIFVIVLVASALWSRWSRLSRLSPWSPGSSRPGAMPGRVAGRGGTRHKILTDIS